MSGGLRIERYLERWSHASDRPLVHGKSLAGVEQAVVIPALAERGNLFFTLASLSRNDPAEIAKTLILVVVNNRPIPCADPADLHDNRETLRCLDGLREGRLPGLWDGANREITAAMEQVLDGGLRLGFIDASSPGREMPARSGGVGLARRMGMDAALACLHRSGEDFQCILLSLDADTLVEENYLSEAGEFFRRGRWAAAFVDFAHRADSQDPLERDAILRYEIFLRYYRLGLCYAGSPYAFFAIGSAMACRDRSYAAVRGMCIRDAAEDFYFLNKLAKVGPIGQIDRTKVHPSSRRSVRVPFGTGKTVGRYLDGDRSVDLLYDPVVFEILRKWLCWMEGNFLEEEENILSGAEEIHPRLASFLKQCGFSETWRRIRHSAKQPEVLRRHFHGWFDGFKTLKLIRRLTDSDFPRRDAFEAASQFCRMLNISFRMPEKGDETTSKRMEVLLDHLRSIRRPEEVVSALDGGVSIG